jgi:hypothetical protein
LVQPNHSLWLDFDSDEPTASVSTRTNQLSTESICQLATTTVRNSAQPTTFKNKPSRCDLQVVMTALERDVEKVSKLIVQEQSVRKIGNLDEAEFSTASEIRSAPSLVNCPDGSCLSSAGSNGSCWSASTAPFSYSTASPFVCLVVTPSTSLLTFLCRKESLSAVAAMRAAQGLYKRRYSQERQKINRWSVLPQRSSDSGF